MNILPWVVLVSLASMACSGAQERVLSEEAQLRNIRVFIKSSPTAVTKSDLSYQIKIPEKQRREAIARCDALLKKGRSNGAMRLRGELTRGEGRKGITVASFGNGEEETRRISKVLGANLIPYSCIGNSLGSQVVVSDSHASRARFLIASVILNEIEADDLLRTATAKITIGEGLEIGLLQSMEGGTRWVDLKPEVVVREYIE
jgi:hypothetical protein